VSYCSNGKDNVTTASCSCNTNCSTCSLVNGGSASCLACSGDLLVEQGECVSSCSSGYTLDSSTHTCRINPGKGVTDDDEAASTAGGDNWAGWIGGLAGLLS
jgi:hypothetical protein